ncbi:hypothetical protein Lal_00039178 [Lupinus albus]|nr:hypothetical protein Lal_00039178 [Lupinus albus]
MNLPFHSVADTDYVFVSLHSMQYSNFEHSENMAQPSTLSGPCERILRELNAPDFTFGSLCTQYDDVPCVLKTRLIHLLSKFHGLAGEDPHKHLNEFHIVCSTMKRHDVQEDQICLKVFPHFLEGPTKYWFYYLAHGSITSWGDLKRSTTDAASGGELGDMTPFEAIILIENMASNSQQFNERSNDVIVVRGVHAVGIDAVRHDKIDKI